MLSRDTRNEKQEFLLAKVNQSGECWEWRAAVGRDGYGRVGFAGKIWLAHRLAYELFVGPIPVGLDLDHLCRNRRCVNPAHLEPVTRRENLRRGRNWHREKTHCKYGHEFTTENTYGRHDGGRDCRACRNARIRKHRAPRQVASC